MSRPLIGITSDTDAEARWCRQPNFYGIAVEKAGGIPVVLPYAVNHGVIPELVDRLDGIIFMGGDDLNPEAYGEKYHPKTSPVQPAREAFERALMAEVERRRMPTLGICMGCQLMNITRGGSMIQFLPDLERDRKLEHRRLNPLEEVRHPVTLVEDSIVARLLGKREVLANSSHKQAVKNLGRGLKVNAMSQDGIIEGVEDPTYPLWLGVQWHPERLHNEDDHLALFRLLVDRINQR
jgi:putative glutamine amidotransferase